MYTLHKVALKALNKNWSFFLAHSKRFRDKYYRHNYYLPPKKKNPVPLSSVKYGKIL